MNLRHFSHFPLCMMLHRDISIANAWGMSGAKVATLTYPYVSENTLARPVTTVHDNRLANAVCQIAIPRLLNKMQAEAGLCTSRMSYHIVGYQSLCAR